MNLKPMPAVKIKEKENEKVKSWILDALSDEDWHSTGAVAFALDTTPAIALKVLKKMYEQNIITRSKRGISYYWKTTKKPAQR